MHLLPFKYCFQTSNSSIGSIVINSAQAIRDINHLPCLSHRRHYSPHIPANRDDRHKDCSFSFALAKLLKIMAANNICSSVLFLILNINHILTFTLLPKQPSQNQMGCFLFIVYRHTIKFQTTLNPSGGRLKIHLVTKVIWMAGTA